MRLIGLIITEVTFEQLVNQCPLVLLTSPDNQSCALLPWGDTQPPRLPGDVGFSPTSAWQFWHPFRLLAHKSRSSVALSSTRLSAFANWNSSVTKSCLFSLVYLFTQLVIVLVCACRYVPP